MTKILAIVLLYIGAFVWMNHAVPQAMDIPPKEEKFDPAKLQTKKDVVTAGRKLYFGKGKCALCHSIEPSELARCPALGGIGARLTKEFFIDSLLHPKSYIYKDYRGDTPKPFAAEMPAINKPPIDLTMQEIIAVVAFLQSLGGEVTVEPEELFATSDTGEVSSEEIREEAPAQAETKQEEEA